MMFWIIVAVVVVVLFALAWWSSGRAKGSTVDRDAAVDRGTSESKGRAGLNQIGRGGGGIGGA